jgi:lipopolysaccharide export system protein LptC
MMTDATPVEERAAFAGFGFRRPRAFVQADRHSQRVRFFRRAIVVVCLSAFGLLGFISLCDPLSRLKAGLTVASVGLSGTKVTIHDPKLSGTRSDGHPYEVKASTATQDTRTPTVLELTGVDLRLGQGDGSMTRITAHSGRYDTDQDRLDLVGSVRFRNEGSYDMALDSALMDMRGGQLSTDRPAVVTVPSGKVEADSLVFSDRTQMVTFTGHVRSSFQQPQSDAQQEATQ